MAAILTGFSNAAGAAARGVGVAASAVGRGCGSAARGVSAACTWVGHAVQRSWTAVGENISAQQHAVWASPFGLSAWGISRWDQLNISNKVFAFVPGFLIGTVGGGAVAAGVGAFRTIVGTGKTLGYGWDVLSHMCKKTTAACMPGERSSDFTLDLKNANTLQTGAAYILGGFAGAVISTFIAAGIGFGRLVVGTGRTISYGWDVMCHMQKKTTATCMPGENESNSTLELKNANTFQTGAAYILGGFAGAVTSAFAAAAIGFGRLVVGTGRTIGYGWNVMRYMQSNTASYCVSGKSSSYQLNLEKGNILQKGFAYVLGGFAGVVTSAFAAVAIGFGRTISNAAKTTIHMPQLAYNAALSDESEAKASTDSLKATELTKTTGFRYLGGAIGMIPFGALLSAGAWLVASTGRLIQNIAINTKAHFVYWNNLVLDPKSQRTSSVKEEDQSQNLFYRYAGKFFGAIVGTAASVITMPFVAGYRIISEGITSFKRMNGSFWNMAFSKKSLKGMWQDDRTWQNKALGILGYGVAAIPCALAVGVRAIRIATPVVVGFIPALVGAAFIGLGKGLKKLFCISSDPVTKELEDMGFQNKDVTTVIDGFKHLHHHLDYKGEFQTSAILPEGDGTLAFSRELMKVFTFNSMSMAEEFLKLMIVEFRVYMSAAPNRNAREFFTDANMDGVVETTQGKVNTCQGVFAPTNAGTNKTARNQTVRKISQMVNAFMLMKLGQPLVDSTAPAPSAPPFEPAPSAPPYEIKNNKGVREFSPKEEVNSVGSGFSMAECFFGKQVEPSAPPAPKEQTPSPIDYGGYVPLQG